MSKLSLKDGRVEAVAWIIITGGHILVERIGEQSRVPFGFIDTEQDTGDNYIGDAAARLCKDSFSLSGFNPTGWSYVNALDCDGTLPDGSTAQLRLYYFAVQKWDGHIPQTTKDNNPLVWIPTAAYEQLPYACDKQALQQLLQ